MASRSDIVALKAKITFEKIKEVRKTMPNKFKWQRDLIDAKVKDLQDEWWEDVKGYFGHGE